MKSQIKQQQIQTKLQIPQPKAVSDISNFLKSMKTVDLKTIQTCSRGKTKQSSWIQTILGKIKLKGGSKISKIWENGCSCNTSIL